MSDCVDEENDDFEDIPKYEKEEYFIGSLGLSMDERKDFFENLANVLRNLGVSYTRHIAKKYYDFLIKNKKNYKKANKELEKEILFSN